MYCSTDEGCVSDQSSVVKPHSVHNEEKAPVQSLSRARSDKNKSRNSVQNSPVSQCSARVGLGLRAKLVLPAEQDSVKFYTKAEEINSTATQEDTYDVDEHISQQRPNRQRRFATK